MSEEPPEYHSYLLRLWRSSSQGNDVWRASLESAQTGERRGFADLAGLFAFLEEQTEEVPATTSARSPAGRDVDVKSAMFYPVAYGQPIAGGDSPCTFVV